jgi:hypothetical protein
VDVGVRGWGGQKRWGEGGGDGKRAMEERMRDAQQVRRRRGGGRVDVWVNGWAEAGSGRGNEK